MTETISDTRRDLTVHVARFDRESLDAEPVVFGDHLLIPHATSQLLLDVAADIKLIAARLSLRYPASRSTGSWSRAITEPSWWPR